LRLETGRRCPPLPPARAPAAGKKARHRHGVTGLRGRRRKGMALGFSRALLLIYRPKKVGWMLTVDLEIDDIRWLQANMGRIRPRRVEALGRLAGPAVGCWVWSPCGC
jgi:hypothetical protein